PVDRRAHQLRRPEGRVHRIPAPLLRERCARGALPPLVLPVHRALRGDRHEAERPLARDLRLGAGAPRRGAQLRARPGEVHRLCLRLGPRAPDHAALWHRRPAPVLRRRPALPRAVLMNIPESWLRALCNPRLSGRELADKLTMAGVEVEAYEPVGPKFANVVVGEVLEVKRHPNADKLSVCKVKAGKETVQVVCGAPNVRGGMKAPLATIGTKEIRGVRSQGMLCSARDLGLSDDHSGLLEIEGKTGSDARAALGLDDHILTLKLTPNRADCLSVLGVAREVSALTKTRLKPVEIRAVPARSKARHPVKLPAPEGCGRFTGRVIRGVNARAPSPAWMRERLERAGQR